MSLFKKKYRHEFVDPKYTTSGICTLKDDILHIKGAMIYTCNKCGKQITLPPMGIINLTKKQLYGCKE
jgi:DNA-directed RNA polymerase subunit RPC12/RpoP